MYTALSQFHFSPLNSGGGHLRAEVLTGSTGTKASVDSIQRVYKLRWGRGTKSLFFITLSVVSIPFSWKTTKHSSIGRTCHFAISRIQVLSHWCSHVEMVYTHHLYEITPCWVLFNVNKEVIYIVMFFWF